jgi:chromosome segregation ATPase
MITLGGDAELELLDQLNPFEEGIRFSVRPPKKSWKNISNLSGGEKTLSSLSLVFALHHFKPTPLYVMDEIDAALDFRNVSIVANYIKERTKVGLLCVMPLDAFSVWSYLPSPTWRLVLPAHLRLLFSMCGSHSLTLTHTHSLSFLPEQNAQFIIISLRNNMFELADRLVGIYKTNNATKSVTITPKSFHLPHEAASVY